MRSRWEAAICLVCGLAGAAAGQAQRPGHVPRFAAPAPRQVLRIALRNGQPSSLSFSTDGRRLTGIGRRGVFFWDSRTGKELGRFAPPGGAAETVLALSPGEAVAACRPNAPADSNRVLLRDAKSGALKRTLRVPSDLHAAGVGSVVDAAAFAPTSPLLAIGDGLGAISLWDANTGRRRWATKPAAIETLGVTADDLAFSPDGRILAVGLAPTPAERRGGEVQVYETATGRRLWSRIDARSFAPVAISPDGRFLAMGGEAVRLRDLRTGRLLLTVRQRGHYEVWWLALSGRFLIGSGSQDAPADEKPEIRAWEPGTGRLLWSLRFGDCGPVAASPQGDTFAAEVGGTIQVWRLR
jgi:WD40 repeat protein